MDSDEEIKEPFTGDAGDSLYSSRDQIFTTYDRSNCAVDRMGAWWHKDCTDSNLFGMYVNGWVTSMAGKGIYWKTCGWLRY
uniref:Fibrinogen C-terminal domain-containing protein n=1 Tax=Drosophila pseudoobscura pseudoobscura TaxID=46245 RepID=A0A0R3NXE4_DROPS